MAEDLKDYDVGPTTLRLTEEHAKKLGIVDEHGKQVEGATGGIGRQRDPDQGGIVDSTRAASSKKRGAPDAGDVRE